MLLKEKEEIIAWLNKHKIENYTLRPENTYGYVVDVDGDVYLANKMLDHLAVKFGHVKRSFYCYTNRLTSLEGSPESIEQSFYCNENQLTSLEGGPQRVGGYFDCSYNQLPSLEGSPQRVGADFWCMNNQLSSLIGGPFSVGEAFVCNDNNLKSLDGMPKEVEKFFVCYNNPGLGELQDFKTFAELKVYMLSQKLSDDLNDSGKKVKKIKL